MLGSWCLVMLAATVPAFAQTLTSTSTLTAIVTVSKCNPTNTGKYIEMRVTGGGGGNAVSEIQPFYWFSAHISLLSPTSAIRSMITLANSMLRMPAIHPVHHFDLFNSDLDFELMHHHFYFEPREHHFHVLPHVELDQLCRTDRVPQHDSLVVHDQGPHRCA